MDEILANLDYTYALGSAAEYNGISEIILSWLDLKPQENTQYIYPPTNYGASYAGSYYDQLQIFWMLAVIFFGDYGTSPRYGWIENVEGFHAWILNMTALWRASQLYDGPEEYRILLGSDEYKRIYGLE